MKETLLKRKSKEGFLFFNQDRTFKSKIFETREARELAMDKYVVKQLKLNKESEEKRRAEKELIKNT